MSRIYCFVEATDPTQNPHIKEWTLDKEESHHLLNVLRVKKGDCVYAIDGKGSRWECHVAESTSRKHVVLTVLKYDYTPKHGPKLILIQSLAKGKHFEELIRHSTELGVDCIIPVETDRTEVHVIDKKEERKHEKWANILKDACKQSGNTHLPYLMGVESLKKFFKKTHEVYSENCLYLIASLEPDALPVKQVFVEKLKSRLTIEDVVWLIGPEGDFSEEEYALAREVGFIPVRLTDNVLRVETAAWYALSVTRYTLDGQ